MNKLYDIVRVQSIEGREKPAYHNCGVMIMKPDGKISIKLNSIPVGDWNGWFNVFPKKDQPQVAPAQSDSDLEPF